ncbi:MAG: histidine phosphatase family protein [Chlorobi bacterium]|nr:histidine phosphatase family protein [Chlorobiota bacterium]MCI0715953.1 histidine phosphatase family protein [Chlorobiota bacterium]
MRTLYLVRHAKSSWNYPELSDIERPLNKRGKSDAPKMGRLLRKKDESPDLMVSSSAKRAFGTAKRIAKEIGYPVKKIVKDETLYMADTEEFFSVIKDTPDKASKLMLIAHNYGITYFANYISDSSIDNIPTCGIVRIDFKIDSWKDIEKNKGKMIYFEYPKKHKDSKKDPDGI